MGLGRQAHILEPGQLETLEAFMATTWQPVRNRAIVLLNYKAGLRAIEIGSLRWRMVLTADRRLARTIALEDRASKGRAGGRPIPVHRALRTVLEQLQPPDVDPAAYVIRFRKGSRDRRIRSAAVQALFRGWYRALELHGASSHSGRRFFLTRAAQHLGRVPHSSLVDVQALAGHRRLTTTERYIDRCSAAQRALVELA